MNSRAVLRWLYAEQAQYHGLQAMDTRRHLVTPSTDFNRAGYSTATKHQPLQVKQI